MELVLTNSGMRITNRTSHFTGPDGEGEAPTTPTVTITRDSDGTAIVTDGAAADEGNGVVSFALDPTTIPDVDRLTAVWSATGDLSVETEAEVVGAPIATHALVASALTDVGGAAASAGNIRLNVERAGWFIEQRCGVAFRPSYNRETLYGDGTNCLLAGKPRLRRIITATLDGTDVLADLTITTWGEVARDAAFPAGSKLELTYEHGWPSPPEDICRAAVKLAREYLQKDPSNYDQRAGRIDTESASYGFLVTAGTNGAETSLPEVNEAINSHRYVVIG